MRSLLVLSLSAAVLSACSSVQENPNYQYSTTYRGDVPQGSQYAQAGTTTVTTVAPTTATYQTIPYEAAPVESVQYQTAPVQSVPYQDAPIQAAPVQAAPIYANSVTAQAAAPTDTLYNGQDVTGTPGFMALQNAEQTAQTTGVQAVGVQSTAAPTYSYAQTTPHTAQTVTPVTSSAAGTPVAYDYSRNLISADAITTGQQIPESVRVLQGAGNTGHNYTVQQGDTVYSLSRRTCVGVGVIQSMNGLNADYGIKIGQSLTLPASVC